MCIKKKYSIFNRIQPLEIKDVKQTFKWDKVKYKEALSNVRGEPQRACWGRRVDPAWACRYRESLSSACIQTCSSFDFILFERQPSVEQVGSFQKGMEGKNSIWVEGQRKGPFIISRQKYSFWTIYVIEIFCK